MSLIVASAPGKVVLCGEYAVLDDAPAIAMAVSRRALVRVSRGLAGVHAIGPVADGDTTLFDAVTGSLGYDRPDGVGFELDTRSFMDANTRAKLGIGSSAALTVALVAGIRRVVPALESSSTLAQSAARAHRALQGGAGSGIDVAASCAGGLVEFRREGLDVRRIEWPQGLHYALLWSGVAASTPARVDAYTDGTSQRAGLCDAAAAAAEHWRRGDAGQLIAATRDFIDALKLVDTELGLGVFAAGHETLCKLGSSGSLVYKPCGAGGGDVGIVLGTDRAELDAFVEQAIACGFRPLDAELEVNGVALSGVTL